MLSYDVIDWGKPLEQRERATPTPQGSEVLVKLKYCGVCHSDVHIDIRPLSAVSRTLDELKRVTIVGRVVAAIS
jgi:threonine dehydrogenase-like Zn-dependent dehydrogenase